MRIAGFVFLVLGTYKILSAFFALSAGWGDIAIGATASFAAVRLANPAHRKGFIFWQVLGITDLVNALALGTRRGRRSARNPHFSHDRPSDELHFQVRRAIVSDPTHHLYRAGAPLASDTFCCNGQ
jgi:hypothetical protein